MAGMTIIGVNRARTPVEAPTPGGDSARPEVRPPLGAAMTGTVSTPTSRRAAVAVVAAGAAVLLAGCGGTDPDASADATPATPAAGTAASSGGSDFCDQAAGIDDRVDAAVSDVGDDSSIPDAFRQLTAELRAIQPPAAIADDWDTMAAGLERMTDALADIDVTDPSSLEALDAAEGDLSTASDHVDAYLRDECGIGS